MMGISLKQPHWPRTKACVSKMHQLPAQEINGNFAPTKVPARSLWKESVSGFLSIFELLISRLHPDPAKYPYVYWSPNLRYALSKHVGTQDTLALVSTMGVHFIILPAERIMENAWVRFDLDLPKRDFGPCMTI